MVHFEDYRGRAKEGELRAGPIARWSECRFQYSSEVVGFPDRRGYGFYGDGIATTSDKGRWKEYRRRWNKEWSLSNFIPLL